MEAKVAESKKKTVAEMLALIKEYPIVGIVNLEGLPAQQLQSMRSDLRDSVKLFMTKKRLIKIAIEQSKGDKKGIEALEKEIVGMPAILLTKESPFKLSKTLAKSKTAAPAKAGQIAPNDIVVPAGPTPFAPGPVISELGEAGLEVGVENGKVAVKADSVVAKKGEEISQKVAEVLTRLDIKPMTIGLDLVAAYEEGIIYGKDVLEVDEQEYLDKLDSAAVQAFNLAFNATWITKDNVELFITKAFNDAKGLGLEQNIIDEGVIDELLTKSERSALSVKSAGNIETGAAKPAPKDDKPAAEEKKEEKEASAEAQAPAEEKKEEPKQEAAPEAPKEEAKPEPAKEAPKAEEKPAEQSQSTESKPEEKAEDKKTEADKEAKEMKEAEDLTKELIQKGTLRN